MHFSCEQFLFLVTQVLLWFSVNSREHAWTHLLEGHIGLFIEQALYLLDSTEDLKHFTVCLTSGTNCKHLSCLSVQIWTYCMFRRGPRHCPITLYEPQTQGLLCRPCKYTALSLRIHWHLNCTVVIRLPTLIWVQVSRRAG